MKKVTGFGGLFFKAADAQKSRNWYAEHLGIPMESWGVMFPWLEKENPEKEGYTVFSPFKHDTDYMSPSTQPFMINFRVDDLHALLAQLKKEGIECIGEPYEDDFGKFGWILDPDGVKIELWEPPKK